MLVVSTPDVMEVPAWRRLAVHATRARHPCIVIGPPPRVVCGPGTAWDNICCTDTVISDPACLAEHLRRGCESEPPKKIVIGWLKVLADTTRLSEGVAEGPVDRLYTHVTPFGGIWVYEK